MLSLLKMLETVATLIKRDAFWVFKKSPPRPAPTFISSADYPAHFYIQIYFLKRIYVKLQSTTFGKLLVVLAFDTCKLRLLLMIAVNDESGQFTSGEAVGIDSLGVRVELETALGVVTVDDGAALVDREEGLIMVP